MLVLTVISITILKKLKAHSVQGILVMSLNLGIQLRRSLARSFGELI
jgi:hypothetical protein